MNIIVFLTFSVTETPFLQYSPGHYIYVTGLNYNNTFKSESLSLTLWIPQVSRNGSKIYVVLFIFSYCNKFIVVISVITKVYKHVL